MIINKETLFNDFFGKNKNRKIFIGIDNTIHLSQYQQFLNLFDSKSIEVTLYNNMSILEEKISNFNDIIYILLVQNDVFLQNIKNDSRIFIFHLTNYRLPLVKIENITNIIDFNLIIESYTLLNAFIKYTILNPNLYVDISKFHGFGLYTSKKILRGECIFKLNGKIVNKDVINDKNFIGEWNALANNLYLIRNDRTSYGFINHSRTPNCKINTNTMEVITLSDIEKNTELLLDYRNEPLSEDYIKEFGRTYL